MTRTAPVPRRGGERVTSSPTRLLVVVGYLLFLLLPVTATAQSGGATNGATTSSVRSAGTAGATRDRGDTRDEAEELSLLDIAPRARAAGRRAVADQVLGEMPEFTSLNPSIVSRSGIRVQPYRLPRRGWSYELRTSWSSVIENESTWESRYLFDAEVVRAEVEIARDVGRRAWLSGAFGVTSAFDGVMDGFLDWYHDAIGFRMYERDGRPRNVFGDTLVLNGEELRARDRGGVGLSDVRLTTGIRWGAGGQTALTVTLPTASSANVDWRGVPTVAVIQTARARLAEVVLLEVTGGASYAPRSGPARQVQRRWTGGGSTAARIRVTGRHSLYGILFFHSSPYVSTGLRTKDSGELSTDFGYAYRWPDGRELRIGLSEDLVRQDQGVDVGLRISFVR